MAGAELMGFFALWVVVSAVAVAATALIVRGEISIRPAFDRRRWLEFLRQSIAYSIAAAVGLIYFRVAVVSISALSTDLEAGYYAAPFRIIETAANIPWMFVTSVFPILARAATRDTARLRYAVQRVTEVGLIVGVWMTLVLIVAAKPAIEVIGGLPEFAPSIPVLRLQALTLVSTFLVATWSLLLLSLHQHRTLLIANALAVVVAVIAAVLLIPPMGAEGGALTTIVAETFLAGAYIVAQRRSHPEISLSLGVLPKLALAAALGSRDRALAAARPRRGRDLLRRLLRGAAGDARDPVRGLQRAEAARMIAPMRRLESLRPLGRLALPGRPRRGARGEAARSSAAGSARRRCAPTARPGSRACTCCRSTSTSPRASSSTSAPTRATSPTPCSRSRHGRR